MDRPIVVTVTRTEVAREVGRELRWPVVDDPDHAAALVAQGFSCVAVDVDGDGLPDCHVVAAGAAAEPGEVHQLLSASPGLDPLRLNADVGTFAWVTDDDGRVLLVRHAYGRRAWGLPGGTLEVGENPDAAVVREVTEETGYLVQADRVVALYGRRQHIGIYFTCTLLGGEARTDFDTEVAEVGWFRPADPPAPCSPVVGMLAADLGSAEKGAVSRFF